MAKIAVELEQALAQRAKDGAPGGLSCRVLAEGDGWTVEDVVCTAGPRDRKFEERHPVYRIAIVVAGSFECRAESGRALMTPGSLLLGNAGECFECSHEHGAGDRCVSFGYAPELFERLTEGADFCALRLPPVTEVSSVVARACMGLTTGVDWEEFSIQLAGQVVALAAGTSAVAQVPSGAASRISRVIRRIDHDPSGPLALTDLAREAGLSPYHFLRTFERLTGVAPHQYLRRARLRNAAVALGSARAKVLDIALDSGFGDVSNFNRVFRVEFGMSPRAYRALAGRANCGKTRLSDGPTPGM